MKYLANYWFLGQDLVHDSVEVLVNGDLEFDFLDA